METRQLGFADAAMLPESSRTFGLISLDRHGMSLTMRFSVCIVLTTAVIAGCGGKEAADPNARPATEWALSRGGTVVLNEADSSLKKGKPIPDGNLTVEKIELDRLKITDDDLDQLAGLTNLKHLGLHSARITTKGIDKIVALPTLTELELSYTNLDDAGMEKLKALPQLEKLYIYGTRVTKDGIENFRKERPKVTVLR